MNRTTAAKQASTKQNNVVKMILDVEEAVWACGMYVSETLEMAKRVEETSGDWLGKESENELPLRQVQCLKLNALCLS